jgi:hypothetical protein
MAGVAGTLGVERDGHVQSLSVFFNGEIQGKHQWFIGKEVADGIGGKLHVFPLGIDDVDPGVWCSRRRGGIRRVVDGARGGPGNPSRGASGSVAGKAILPGHHFRARKG